MRPITLDQLASYNDVVEYTQYHAADEGGGTTIIWFRSHRWLCIVDTPTEHRVEAYTP